MLLSMTGYGKACKNTVNKKITFELKSLNSKQIDLLLKIPNAYKEKELEIRKTLFDNILRGKVEATLSIDDNSVKGRTVIDADVVESYFLKLKQIAEDKHIPQPTDWFQTLFAIPDVLNSETLTVDDTEWNSVQNIINEAIIEFDKFRRQEGDMLENYLTIRINNIYALLQQIEPYENERIEKIRQQISDDFAVIKDRIDFDENRFAQEMIFYIEKLDISEEKTRLKCHLDYFLETIKNEQNQGKKLGFIAQEIGREINTLGSKSNHSQMQHIVVKMKDELEQIKEQILNVL